MELRLLRYFLAVAQEENITRAAEQLHIAQPSLSKQMMELEQEFGKQLFIRGKRKITLTEEGILLRKRATEILMLCEKTGREIAQISAMVNGELAIGGGSSATVAKTIAMMAKKYPNVRYQILNGDAEKISEYLEHGALDFGILLEPVDLTKYEHLLLPETDEWGFLLRKDSPLAEKEVIRPEDIKDVPLILPQRTGLQKELSSWSGHEIDELNVTATFDIFFNNPILLVKSGVGCAYALNSHLDTDGSKTLCFRPLDPPIEIRYGLVWKKYSVLSKAAEKFLEEIRALVGEKEFEV